MTKTYTIKNPRKDKSELEKRKKKKEIVIDSNKKTDINKVVQLLVGLGLGIFGAKLVLFAILDPEPTSKLGTLVIGGITLVFAGSLITVSSLGQKWELSLGNNKLQLKMRRIE